MIIKNITSEKSGTPQQSRREFVRKAIYASPVLLTLPATPSFAQQGSGGGSTGGGVCPPGSVDLCDQTINGVSICDLPIDQGGLPNPGGGAICTS